MKIQIEQSLDQKIVLSLEELIHNLKTCIYTFEAAFQTLKDPKGHKDEAEFIHRTSIERLKDLLIRLEAMRS